MNSFFARPGLLFLIASLAFYRTFRSHVFISTSAERKTGYLHFFFGRWIQKDLDAEDLIGASHKLRIEKIQIWLP